MLKSLSAYSNFHRNKSQCQSVTWNKSNNTGTSLHVYSSCWSCLLKSLTGIQLLRRLNCHHYLADLYLTKCLKSNLKQNCSLFLHLNVFPCNGLLTTSMLFPYVFMSLRYLAVLQKDLKLFKYNNPTSLTVIYTIGDKCGENYHHFR